MITVAFSLRVLFETELNWYYLWPIAALCLVLSARRGSLRLGLCSAALVASIVLGNHNVVHHIALWWPELMLSLTVMLASAAGTTYRRTVAPPRTLAPPVLEGNQPWEPHDRRQGRLVLPDLLERCLTEPALRDGSI
jgi:hypothetical protein